jgi:hypothetical protein
VTGVITTLLGILCVWRALAWRSPFSPVLIGYGLAYVSFSGYFHLHKPGLGGTLARMTLFLPGTAFIATLAAMWFWGRL